MTNNGNILHDSLANTFWSSVTTRWRPIARFLICVSTLLLVTVAAQYSHAESLKVAVASNFSGTMKRLVKQFEQQTSHNVIVSYGSSGKLFAQIIHGAPFDLFLSADQELPSKLVALGHADSSQQFTYALGRLVLWSADSNAIDEKASRLKSGDYAHVALANPRFAPYGRAAIETLNALGLVVSSESKLVQGENVAQAYQFIHSGNAEMGFIALAQLYGEGLDRLDKRRQFHGSKWIVPDALYSPIRQDLVVLNRGQAKQIAQQFFDFMRGDVATSIISKSGYSVSTNHD